VVAQRGKRFGTIDGENSTGLSVDKLCYVRGNHFGGIKREVAGFVGDYNRSKHARKFNLYVMTEISVELQRRLVLVWLVNWVEYGFKSKQE